MPNNEDRLRPAADHDLIRAIAHALQFQRRKRVHHADSFVARIAAERLVNYLRAFGFILMKKPGLENHGVGWGD